MLRTKGEGKSLHNLAFPKDVDYINRLHDLSISARKVDGLENAGIGKIPPYWGSDKAWVRERFPAIKVASRALGDKRHEVKTLEELGFNYREYNSQFSPSTFLDLVGIGSNASEGHARPSDFMAWCNKDKGYARQLTPWGSQKVVKPLGPLQDRAELACAMARKGWNEFTNQADYVIQCIDVVVNGALVPLLHVRSELREANEAAFRSDQLDQSIALVARMLLESTRQDMGEARWLSRWRVLNSILGGLRANVAKINHYPKLRHLVDDLPSESGQA
ncbi:monooxygenase [Extremus antarcticus]|uniref:Monooxygenase n=1 Tax=Extremus antarcticus TaxID=702011 RepID=A0AAJ0DJ88_9PEZI|nr:monooxygenase [Extremus antarcticus]